MKLTNSLRVLSAAVAFAAGVSSGYAAQTLGPVTDEIGVVKINKGDPIFIGGYWVLSGPDTALGLDQKRAVELVFDESNNRVAGHPIKFVAEDGQCNPEGGQTAATKLASNPSIVVVIGPSCSSEATPGAPILWKAGIPSIGTSPSAPSLTAPDRKPGYFGFVRTIYSDVFEGKFDAEYLYNVVGCRSLATVHDGSPYAQQLQAVAADDFKKLGGTVTGQEAVAPTDVDMRPMLTRVATGKPQCVYFPIFVAAAAQIARQGPEILPKGTHILGGSALLAPSFIEAAGKAAVGFKFFNPDTSPEAYGKKYPAFVKAYQKKFGEEPIQGFHAQAHDGAQIALMAIQKVAKKDAQGNTYIGRKALRDAIFATKGYDGLSGTITCNPNGDCGVFKGAVYEFTSGDPKTFKIGVNPKKIYPK